MYYYLICRAEKLFANVGAITDFGPDIDEEKIVDFVKTAMIENWEIELVQEPEMEALNENDDWTAF